MDSAHLTWNHKTTVNNAAAHPTTRALPKHSPSTPRALPERTQQVCRHLLLLSVSKKYYISTSASVKWLKNVFPRKLLVTCVFLVNWLPNNPTLLPHLQMCWVQVVLVSNKKTITAYACFMENQSHSPFTRSPQAPAFWCLRRAIASWVEGIRIALRFCAPRIGRK